MKTILLTATNSRNAGGLFYSVKNLAWSIINQGVDTAIVSYNDEYSKEDILTYKNIPMKTYSIDNILKRIGYSFDIDDVIYAEHPQIIHQQGIWLYHSHASLKYKEKNKHVKTIIAPRGMLDPWLKRNSPIAKKIVGWWYENKNLRSADCFHALCKSEYESIRLWGLKNPVAIIPNGTTIPSWHRNFSRIASKKTVLYLSRIDKKKGLDILLKAINNIERTNKEVLQGWIFLIAGWGDKKYRKMLENYVSINNLGNYVKFRGPAYGNEKVELLKNADVFILPSHSEGLPMAVLEAWAYELPVIMTDYCNLPEGFENNAAFRIDTEIMNMTSQLIDFLKLSDEKRNSMAINGRQLVEDNFSWDVIGAKTKKLYEWLLGMSEKPEYVIVD